MPRWLKEFAAALLATAAVLFAIYRFTPIVTAQGHGGAVWGPTAVGTAPGSLPFGAPVLVGGTGNNGSVQIISTNNAGRIILSDSAQSGTFSSSGSALVDGQTNSPTGLTIGAAGTEPFYVYNYLFNGSTWDRQRTASLANFPTAVTLTARNSIGAEQTEKGSRWSVVSAPAVSTQASASIAAEASVRHVVDCVSFSATTGGSAPTNTDLVINVRDGATGAGTVIWTWNVSNDITAAAASNQYVAPHSICGLNLPGTTNTAMTAEFSALLTNLNESVSISGYNVN